VDHTHRGATSESWANRRNATFHHVGFPRFVVLELDEATVSIAFLTHTDKSTHAEGTTHHHQSVGA
jgi:glutaredoxin 2